MFEFCLTGIVLGVSAGISPGPLLALVIAETLRSGPRAGAKVALSPLVTDLPIIVALLFLLGLIAEINPMLGGIALIGGGILLRMGIDCLQTRPLVIHDQTPASRPFFKGVLVNLFSPHTYLFWVGVGAPLMQQAREISWITLGVFLCAFYGSLVGAKLMVAFPVGKSRGVISGKTYVWVMRFLGVALCVLAVFLFLDGLRLLKVI